MTIAQKSNTKTRLKPISLHPLTPEQALSAFMRVDPRSIKRAERKAERKMREK